MEDSNRELVAQLDALLNRFMHMDHGGKEEADEITDLLVMKAAFPVGETLRRDIHLFAQTILHELDASIIGIEGAKRRVIAAAGEALLDQSRLRWLFGIESGQTFSPSRTDMAPTRTPADEAFRLRFMAELQMQAAEMSPSPGRAMFCRTQARRMRVRADLVEQGVPSERLPFLPSRLT